MTDSERLDKLETILVRTSISFNTEGGKLSGVPKAFSGFVGGDPLQAAYFRQSFREIIDLIIQNHSPKEVSNGN